MIVNTVVCIHYEILLTVKGGQSCHLYHHGVTGDLVKRNRSGTHSGEPGALTYMWDLKVMAGCQVIII